MKLDSVRFNDDLTKDLKPLNDEISKCIKSINSELKELHPALKRDAYGAIHDSYEYLFAMAEKLKSLSQKADNKLAEIQKRNISLN